MNLCAGVTGLKEHQAEQEALNYFIHLEQWTRRLCPMLLCFYQCQSSDEMISYT